MASFHSRNALSITLLRFLSNKNRNVRFHRFASIVCSLHFVKNFRANRSFFSFSIAPTARSINLSFLSSYVFLPCSSFNFKSAISASNFCFVSASRLARSVATLNFSFSFAFVNSSNFASCAFAIRVSSSFHCSFSFSNCFCSASIRSFNSFTSLSTSLLSSLSFLFSLASIRHLSNISRCNFIALRLVARANRSFNRFPLILSFLHRSNAALKYLSRNPSTFDFNRLFCIFVLSTSSRHLVKHARWYLSARLCKENFNSSICFFSKTMCNSCVCFSVSAWCRQIWKVNRSKPSLFSSSSSSSSFEGFLRTMSSLLLVVLVIIGSTNRSFADDVSPDVKDVNPRARVSNVV